MAGWIFCRRCSPDIPTNPGGGLGVGGLPTVPNECPGCNVLFITFGFISEDVADLVVGAGNHTAGVAGPWVLFYDSGDYTRDPSRPVDCTVTTIVHPDDPTLDLIMTVSVNGGAFVWTRKSADPLDPGFQLFELTTGTIDVPVCECGQCVSIGTEYHRTPFVWENPPEDFVAGVTLSAGDPSCLFNSNEGCDQDLTSPICLTYDDTYAASLLGIVDGWGFGGRWLWSNIYEGSAATDYDCTEVATLVINGAIGDDCEDQQNGWFGAGNLCCSFGVSWVDCDRDPRTPPTEADFTIELSDTCGGASLDSLSYGGSCDDDDGSEYNCPPDDCPTSWCKWQWDTDNLLWSLIDTNCLEGTECSDPPPDPSITDVAWVTCTCCVETGPNCDPGYEICEGGCSWTWDAAVMSWNPTGCLTLGCTCHGMPESPGLFDGEVRAGVCCRLIV